MIHTFKDDYKWLSNMTLVDIKYNGNTFKSVEHAYQCAKNDSVGWRDICLNEYNPYKIKMLSKNIEIKEDWDSIKLNIMESCLIQKFNQEPFKTLLIQTDDENIQEGNEWGDKFWGVDLRVSPNVGENHLGRIIMKIRTKLKEE